MPGRLGPRFAIEALFLIALAVGVAYADLSRKWIAIVMAGGWLLVALVELTAERIWATAPPWRRPDYYAAPASRREPVAPPAAVEAQPKPAPQALPEPEPIAAAGPEPEAVPEPVGQAEPGPEAEAATVIEPPIKRAEPQPEPEPEPQAEPEPVPVASARPRLEPLDAKPKRRWFRRESEEVPDETTEIPMPKHVRLLSPTERRDSDTDEIAGLFDEENTST